MNTEFGQSQPFIADFKMKKHEESSKDFNQTHAKNLEQFQPQDGTFYESDSIDSETWNWRNPRFPDATDPIINLEEAEEA